MQPTLYQASLNMHSLLTGLEKVVRLVKGEGGDRNESEYLVCYVAPWENHGSLEIDRSDLEWTWRRVSWPKGSRKIFAQYKWRTVSTSWKRSVLFTCLKELLWTSITMCLKECPSVLRWFSRIPRSTNVPFIISITALHFTLTLKAAGTKDMRKFSVVTDLVMCVIYKWMQLLPIKINEVCSIRHQ